MRASSGWKAAAGSILRGAQAAPHIPAGSSWAHGCSSDALCCSANSSSAPSQCGRAEKLALAYCELGEQEGESSDAAAAGFLPTGLIPTQIGCNKTCQVALLLIKLKNPFN
jgi:hypothetical protein